MMTSRRRLAVGGALGFYLLGFGFAVGMVVERLRFDRERVTVLARYDEAVRQWHEFRMAAERASDPGR